MEAVERVFLSNDLVTFSFLFGIVLLFLIKLYNPQRLLGYSIAFFAQGFMEKRVDSRPSFFSSFHGMLFLFSVLTLSIFFYVQPFLILQKSISSFFVVFFSVLCYFVLKYFFQYIFTSILRLNNLLRYFLFSKSAYLYTLCLWLFPVLIVYNYSFTNRYFLIVCLLLLFLFRVFLILINNKKLIFSKLFYFILYFCTLELAPLLILYKLVTA